MLESAKDIMNEIVIHTPGHSEEDKENSIPRIRLFNFPTPADE